MTGFDNSNLKNDLCNQTCNVAGFTPSVSYEYDAEAETVIFTDNSTIPDGDTLTKVHVKVHDKFGGTAIGTITVTDEAGAQTVDVSDLDASKGLNVTATVLTTNHIAADGSAWDIGEAGELGSWDVNQNS